MAGTFGYFLQGLSSGLQTGFNMRMNKMEMDWKKKEKEKLEKAQQDLVEKSQAINSKITEYGSDGYWSENEIMDVNTMVLAGGAEIQSLFKQTMSDIKLGRRDAVNQDFSLINSWSDVFDNLSLEDIDSTYKEMSSYITTPEGKKYLNANVSIKKKKAQAMASQPAKQVSAYDFYSGSPATVQSQIAQSVAGQTPGLEGVQFQEPTPTATSTATMPNYNTAINFLSKFTNPKVFNQQKEMLQKNYGLDLSGVTYESLKKSEAVSGAGEPAVKYRATSLSQLDKTRQEVLNADRWEDAQNIINDYEQAGYDVSQLGITKEDWVNRQQQYLIRLLNMVKVTINEKGWLKGENEIINPQQVNSLISEAKPAPEVYELFREEYMKYRDILEKLGIDVSNFPKLKSLNEIGKVGFWEGVSTLGGVSRGQYKSVYY